MPASAERITWEQAKKRIAELARNKTDFYFRGHPSSTTTLRTTFHRAAEGTGITLKQYLETALPEVAYHVGGLTNEIIDLTNPAEFGALLGLIRHHGFPTPLLDWTLSPYVAVYFAYRDIDPDNLQTEFVRVFAFDFQAWMKQFPQPTDLRVETPYLSVFRPFSRFNQRIIAQRGSATITNVDDIEAYVAEGEGIAKTQFITRFDLSVKERPVVMRELNLMGINDMTLFPGLDGLCRAFKEQIFSKDSVGLTPLERIDLLLSNSEPGPATEKAMEGSDQSDTLK